MSSYLVIKTRDYQSSTIHPKLDFNKYHQTQRFESHPNISNKREEIIIQTRRNIV